MNKFKDAAGRRGIFADVDGTIIAIADHPARARMSNSMKQVIAKLQSQYELAFISGRPLNQVKKIVGLSNQVSYVGSHGFEIEIHGSRLPASLSQTKRRSLTKALERLKSYNLEKRFPGLVLEKKPASLATHYRQTNKPTKIATQLQPILAKVAKNLSLELKRGRKVFELSLPGINKGKAVRTLLVKLSLSSVIYLGDDYTDLDAFAALENSRQENGTSIWKIAVASSEVPEIIDCADLTLDSVNAVEQLFTWLSTSASKTCKSGYGAFTRSD